MRIAYVCADAGIPVFGEKGSSLHVQEILRALRSLGAEIELFATRWDGEAPADLKSLRVHALPASPPGDTAAREQACLAANGALHAALEQADRFDLVYERYALWSFAAMEFARGRGIPGVLEVNAPLIEEQSTYRKLIDRDGAQRVAARVFGAAQVLAGVSQAIATYLEQYPEARGRVHVVPNGVNPQRFAPGTKPIRAGSAGTFTVGFLGNLKPWHGLPILVEAFALLHQRAPNARLLAVGDGNERDNLEADVVARGLDDVVHFTGHVSPAEVPGWLASMDVGVAPYPELSPFYFSPLKLYEYMAAGLPVVGSRIGQLAELIEEGVTGVLCPPGNPAMLAGALDQLRQDAALRARLGRNARDTVLRAHTWEAVARRLLTLAGLEAGAMARSAEVGR